MWTLEDIQKPQDFEIVSLGELRNYCDYVLDNIELSNHIDEVPSNLKQKTHHYQYADSYTRKVVSLWYLDVVIIVFDVEYKGCDYDNLTTYQITIFNPEMYK